MNAEIAKKLTVKGICLYKIERDMNNIFKSHPTYTKNLVNKRNINNFSIIEIEKYIHQMQIVLISKKGYIFEKTLNKFSNNNVIFITNDKNTFHRSKFYKNYESIYLKKLNRAKFELDYIFNLVKKYKGLIFKNFKKAVIFHTVFPKKNMRANSLTVLDENDFI